MPQTTSDPSIQNTDADNAAPRGGSSSKPGYQKSPGESARVAKWHRRIKVARAFDEPARKMYARDRRYARGETGMIVSYSLIQAYLDILVAFLVARDPDIDCPPAENVGQSGLNNAELYGKTMEIVVRHLLKSAKLKRKAERWVRTALTVGIGVLKGTWQEVWESDPYMRDRLKDAQENIAKIRALLQQLQAGEIDDVDEAMEHLKEMQQGLANRAEVLIAMGFALSNIRPEDMVYSVESDNILDTDESPWLGDRSFIGIEEAPSEFESLDRDCLKSATLYSPRKPKDKLDKDSRYNGVVADIEETESDSFVKGGSTIAGGKMPKFVCAWEIWDSDTEMFFTVIEGITDRYARAPQKPPCPTTKFDPYFLLSFTEVDGERHPQSLTTRSSQLQDEIERSMGDMITHRKRAKPKLGFDASKVTRDTIDRLKKGTIEEYVAIKLIAGAADNADLRKILFPIAYSAIDMALYSSDPYIRAMETIWGIQEAMTGSVQVEKTATEADIQQAGTQAKNGYKRDVLESKLTMIAQHVAECASFRMSTQEAQAIAGPEAYWIENATAEDLQSMLHIEIRAGSTGKPDHTARREAWAAVQPMILQTMQAIANFRQTLPVDFADCLEALLEETMERMGDQLNVKRFVPQAPQMPLMDANGNAMSSSQVAAQQAAQAQAGAGGGKPPPGDGAPPTEPGADAQGTMAPTQVPAAIAG